MRLKLRAAEYEESSLTFKSERVTWFRPTTLAELLQLKYQYPTSRLVVGNTEIGRCVSVESLCVVTLQSFFSKKQACSWWAEIGWIKSCSFANTRATRVEKKLPRALIACEAYNTQRPNTFGELKQASQRRSIPMGEFSVVALVCIDTDV